jgi:hypothetical protein
MIDTHWTSVRAAAALQQQQWLAAVAVALAIAFAFYYLVVRKREDESAVPYEVAVPEQCLPGWQGEFTDTQLKVRTASNYRQLEGNKKKRGGGGLNNQTPLPHFEIREEEKRERKEPICTHNNNNIFIYINFLFLFVRGSLKESIVYV